MPVTRELLNHLSTYARLAEQQGASAVTSWDLEEPEITTITLRQLDRAARRIHELVEELLAPPE